MPGFGPTISTALGYLMAEGRYLEWLFEPAPFDYGSESQRMVKAVEVYGIPFMTEDQVLEVFSVGNGRIVNGDRQCRSCYGSCGPSWYACHRQALDGGPRRRNGGYP
jgi:hypothetical protein